MFIRSKTWPRLAPVLNLALTLMTLMAPIAPVALLTPTGASAQRVNVTLDPTLATAPYTGRVFVFFAKEQTRDPRLQAGSYGGSVPFYGVDVDEWRAGTAAAITAKTLGFPYETLAELPAGDYYAQAMLVPYTRFSRADGHVIWVHNDQWEGQQFNRAPGNLVSETRRVHWDPRSTTPIAFVLTTTLPPVTVPPDTRYVKRVKIKSELLSKFWGQPMYIGATVLLPKGFDEEPTRRYPAVYAQGHFGLAAPFGFTEASGSETPVQRDARLRRSAREPGWMFGRDWLSEDFPRMVAITWQHPTPYYDDSYAVNSVNNGPYQDALLTELVPVLEKRFRLIPEANARFLTGGSTGGWECAALQVQRPDFFGGAWCLYPDPVDFHRNQMIDNYADTNAFVPNDGTAPWPERYMSRTEEGQPLLSERMMSRLEEVRGTKARSGEQYDAWDAAYGPIGSDGYPKRLWNRLSGTIDTSVVAWWRDKGYDLTDNMVRNWAKNGPAMAGKLHVYVGDMDNYYLNLAVYRMQDAAATLQNPKANFTFEYGRPMKPHGWQPMTNADLLRAMNKFRAEHSIRP